MDGVTKLFCGIILLTIPSLIYGVIFYLPCLQDQVNYH